MAMLTKDEMNNDLGEAETCLCLIRSAVAHDDNLRTVSESINILRDIATDFAETARKGFKPES
ncbi:hypothetical protein LCGC14_1185420 [marine sediment metagenome]|uniref:Uncharacterized protein n=1 Tax=marine sediment metagenome TaxID=412755 RepID=A0A0F9P3T8_9ZZZZ